MTSLRDAQRPRQIPAVTLVPDDEAAGRFRRVPMKLALVAGVYPKEDCLRFTVVAPDGTNTRALMKARLYAFTWAGRDAAATDAKVLRTLLALGGGWTDFVWRVLVEGPWERPEAVTPVWIIEGHARPVPVLYYFD